MSPEPGSGGPIVRPVRGHSGPRASGLPHPPGAEAGAEVAAPPLTTTGQCTLGTLGDETLLANQMPHILHSRNRSMDEELLGGEGGRRGVPEGGQAVERGFPRGARNGFGGFDRQTSASGFFDRNQPREEDTNGVSPRSVA